MTVGVSRSRTSPPAEPPSESDAGFNVAPTCAEASRVYWLMTEVTFRNSGASPYRMATMLESSCCFSLSRSLST
ncbi:hypothetical protein D3C87_2056730 [compost metagenome]